MKRISITVISLMILLSMALPAAAAEKHPFPDIIPLPDNFNPEGITTGYGHTFYAGSLADGSIVSGDLRTGESQVLVPGTAGKLSVGMDFDERSGYLFVAGGPNGVARVYDGETGVLMAEYSLADPFTNFINDVFVTRQAAFFTNSFAAVIYRIPLGPAGELPDPSMVELIPLSGDWVQMPSFNANGVVATPDGETLIVISSAAQAVYLVDPETGDATQIDLNGVAVPNGDGLVLQGKTLYVVQNFINQIGIISLSSDMRSGTFEESITNPAFRIPTTAALFGESLYAVNARFGQDTVTDPTFEIVKVSKHQN
jgi:sugar lactone lactonase YvrE